LRHGIIPLLVAVFLDCDFRLISQAAGTEKVSNTAPREKLANLRIEGLDKNFRCDRFVVAWAYSEMITTRRPRLEGDGIIEANRLHSLLRWANFREVLRNAE
jgi:hypothetical protein